MTLGVVSPSVGDLDPQFLQPSEELTGECLGLVGVDFFGKAKPGEDVLLEDAQHGGSVGVTNRKSFKPLREVVADGEKIE